MLPGWTIDLLMTAGEAPAQPAAPPGGGGQGGAGGLFNLLVPFLLMAAIFYFLIIRPDSRKRKEREQRLAGARKGDTVITTGGIVGKVWRVDGDEVVLIIDKDKDVKARFKRSALFDMDVASSPASAPPEKDAPEEAKP